MSFENPMAAPEEVPAENNEQKIEDMLDKKETFMGNIPIPTDNIFFRLLANLAEMLDKYIHTLIFTSLTFCTGSARRHV